MATPSPPMPCTIPIIKQLHLVVICYSTKNCASALALRVLHEQGSISVPKDCLEAI